MRVSAPSARMDSLNLFSDSDSRGAPPRYMDGVRRRCGGATVAPSTSAGASFSLGSVPRRARPSPTASSDALSIVPFDNLLEPLARSVSIEPSDSRLEPLSLPFDKRLAPLARSVRRTTSRAVLRVALGAFGAAAAAPQVPCASASSWQKRTTAALATVPLPAPRTSKSESLTATPWRAASSSQAARESWSGAAARARSTDAAAPIVSYVRPPPRRWFV